MGVNDPFVVADGSVYVYERSGPINWAGPIDTLTAPAPSTADGQFGWSVAVQGTTLVVGHRLEDNDAGDPNGIQFDAGAVWVYEGSPGAWGAPTKLVPGDSASANTFGSSVDIDGSTIVVGAAAAEETGVPTRNGAAYVYRSTTGGLWVEADTMRAGDGANEDQFGTTVGVSGDLVIVGSPLDDNPNGIDAGAAYVFNLLTPDNPTLSFSLGVQVGQTPPFVAQNAGIPLSRLSKAAPLIERNADNSTSVGSTALQGTGVAGSALAGTKLGDTPFGAIAVSNEELARIPILNIGLELANGDGWSQILDTPEFEEIPLVNVKVGDVFGSSDAALKASVDAIPFGAIDVGGTPFGAIPFGAIAMGGVRLTDIPPGPDATTPSAIQAGWCDVLAGSSEACVNGVLDPAATLLSISLSDVPFGAIPFGAIPFGAIPVEDVPFGAINLSEVRIGDTPFGAIPFGAIELQDSPFGAIPFGAIPYGAIPFGAIPYETINVGGTTFGAIPFGAIPFGAIDVNGAPFGAIPFGAIALADVNLGAIPLDPDRVTPSEIEADWCSLMAEFNLDCDNPATSVGTTTITDLGVRGVPFGAIPFGAIPYGAIPYGAIPFGAIPFGAIPFGAINLNAIDILDVDLAGTPFGALPFGTSSTSVGAIPFGAIDVQGSPFGAIRLDDIATESTPFGAIPFGAISPESIPFGAIPFGAIPFGAIDEQRRCDSVRCDRPGRQPVRRDSVRCDSVRCDRHDRRLHRDRLRQ